MDYRERFCAFVDILGFSELIEILRNSATAEDRSFNFKMVRELLNTFYSPPKGKLNRNSPDKMMKADGFRAQSISDAIAVSVEPHNWGLRRLFNSLEVLCLDLLANGYFTRGAIVLGRICHDDRMIFGEALIRAYRFESQIARFPRIIVASEVAEVVKNYQSHDEGFSNRIRQADDGPYYLNILRPVEECLALDSDKMRKKYSPIRRQIVKRLEESIDNPSHFEKVQWFARYWNSIMPEGEFEVEGFEQVKGAGLHSPREGLMDTTLS